MRLTHRRQRLRGIAAALIVGIMAGAIGVPAAAFAEDPDIPTSIVIEPHPTWGMISGAEVTATVTPIPTVGEVAFEIRDHVGGALVDQATGTVDEAGHASGQLGTAAYPGTFDLIATFSGLGYAPSTATEVFEVSRFGTSPIVSMTPTSPLVDQSFTLAVIVDFDWTIPSDTSYGSVEVIASKAGVEQSLGTAMVAVDYHRGWASWPVPSGLGQGTWTIVAKYSGTATLEPSDSPPLEVSVATATAQVVTSVSPVIETHHPIVITASIISETDHWWDDATLTFGPVAGTGPGCTMAVSPLNDHTCTIASLPAGTYSYQAIYSGNTKVSGSTSNPTTFEVVSDTLEATGVGVGYTTFYPYKDGYRDSVAISAIRNEPASASIKIYSSSGKRVKSTSVAMGSGKYSYAWNGRTSTGSMLPSGKYRVIQRLTDGAGTTKQFTSYVNLSGKRIYTYTAYINRSIAQATSKSNSSISWDFTIPSATVYKGLAFQVYGRSLSVPGGEFGAYDTRPCDGESGPGCIQKWVGLGWTNKWYSDSLSPTYNRVGRHVYGTVVAYGTAVVYKARVKVIYGLLR